MGIANNGPIGKILRNIGISKVCFGILHNFIAGVNTGFICPGINGFLQDKPKIFEIIKSWGTNYQSERSEPLPAHHPLPASASARATFPQTWGKVKMSFFSPESVMMKGLSFPAACGSLP